MGHEAAADEASRRATSRRREFEMLLAEGPATIDGRVFATVEAAGTPLRLFAAEHPVVVEAAEVIRDRFCVGPAVFDGIGHSGLVPRLTLQLAAVELRAGDRRALDRLAWMLDAATPTFTWPEVVHPALGGGCAGDGHDARVAADFLSLVRDLLVREVADDGVALCSMLPAEWVGQSVEVHDAPTHHGLLSFAVRWHGERPALLWDLRPHADASVRAVRLTAPGLDPSWSTTDAKGEALLAAPAFA
jgi:hypothetical protein